MGLLMSACSTDSGNSVQNTPIVTRTTYDQSPPNVADASPVYPWSNTIDNHPDSTKRCDRPVDAPILFTFDDSGSTQQIETLLAVLDKENIRAAFFPIGDWVEKNLDLITEIKQQGHYVGNHTQTHARLGQIDLTKPGSEAKFYQEIYPLEGVANTNPILLRPPFEDGAYDPAIEDALKAKGIQECTWTADPRDWDGSTASQILNRLEKGDQYTKPIEPGGVILMHMLGEHTVEAIPGIVSYLTSKGITYETLRN